MVERGITVTQLNNYIKQVFDAETLLHGIEVIGDISGIKQSGNGVYFNLRDENATVQCVTFVPGIMTEGGKLLGEGTKVIVRGNVGYWHKAGKINLTVSRCEKFGVSALYKLFLELQEKLKKEGLFDAAQKKQIPTEIKKLGIVTSKTGAVIHDIKNVAHRRNPGLDIAFCDTRVQGVGAENEIVSAIELMQKTDVDVIILARGGGSAEDLMAFNTEVVARAVFSSKKPIVSAVGHETDFTLVDFVADLRAPTPSAAAELCVREVLTDRERVLRLWQNLRSSMIYRLQAKIDKDAKLKSDLITIIREKTTLHSARVENFMTKLEGLNPMEILRKGFSKTDKDLSKLKIGDEFTIMYYTGNKVEKGVATWKTSKK
ncbi:MAG: exodeoxyribonuclease VII large subunit [Firmicutes bacterium]|nr:exodeoxyribonuclease VII large subunit [Bacillota bacterium]